MAKQLAEEGSIELLDAGTWGPMLVARHLFDKLGPWERLDAGQTCCRKKTLTTTGPAACWRC